MPKAQSALVQLRSAYVLHVSESQCKAVLVQKDVVGSAPDYGLRFAWASVPSGKEWSLKFN